MRAILHESRHRLVTHRVELRLHKIINIIESLLQFFCIVRDVFLDLVAERADKSEVIFKLDDQRLIIDCLPSA